MGLSSLGEISACPDRGIDLCAPRKEKVYVVGPISARLNYIKRASSSS